VQVSFGRRYGRGSPRDPRCPAGVGAPRATRSAGGHDPAAGRGL